MADVIIYLQDVIEIGYEQKSCNDEGLTDAGDAIRIFRERHPEIKFTERELEDFHQLVEQDFYKEFNEGGERLP